MATYYVRTDGSNTNAGTGPATNQAWQTIAYAFANMTLTAGVNTLYIAPGVYRESPTLTVTPTVTNTLVITGDPTASQFSGVTANQVRVTGSSTDSTTMAAGNRFNLGSKSYVTIQNLYIEHNSAGNPSLAIVSTGDFVTIRNNVIFSYYLGGSFGGAIQITAPAATGNNILIENNIVFGCAIGIQIIAPAASSGVTGVIVRNNRISTNGWQNGYGVYVSVVSGSNMASVTVSNCVITQFPQVGVFFSNGNTTDKHIVQNCIIGPGATAISATTSNQVTQRNNILLAGNTLNNVATDASTITSDFFGIDFGQALLQGFGNLAPFGTSLNSRNTAFGTATSAPSTDLYGIAWTGATPDVGMVTYRSLSTIGNYLPTERNASTITIAPGSTSQSIELYLGVTGLTFATSNLAAYYVRNQSAPVAITLVTQTATGAWTSGGFAEISSSLVPGVYRLDVPNAAFAAGQPDVTIVVRGASGTNGAVLTVTLSSGGLTAAQTASAVWDATASAYNTAGSMGEAGQKLTGYSLASSQSFNNSGSIGSVTGAVGSVTGAVTVGTNNDKTGYALSTAANTTAADAVWNSTRSGHTTAGTFGQYVNAELVTPVTQSALVRMGPFQVIADGVATPMPLDIQKGAQHGVDIQCVDNNLSAIDITGATITTKVYNSGGTLVATYSGTATYAADGRAQFTITTTVTNTPGTYTATITRTTGASDTQVFGPLRIYVRDI